LKDVPLTIRYTKIINSFCKNHAAYKIIFKGFSASNAGALLLPNTRIFPLFASCKGIISRLSSALKCRSNARFSADSSKRSSFNCMSATTNTERCMRLHPRRSRSFAAFPRRRSFAMS